MDVLNAMISSGSVAGWKLAFYYTLRGDDLDEFGAARFGMNQMQLNAIGLGTVVIVSLVIWSTHRALWHAFRRFANSSASHSISILIDVPLLLSRCPHRPCLEFSWFMAVRKLCMFDRCHLSSTMRLCLQQGLRDESITHAFPRV